MGVIRKGIFFLGRRRRKRVECLFDSGASASFIRPTLVQAVGLPTTDLIRPLRIRLGRGSIQVFEIAAIMIRLNGVTLADTAYILPGLTEEYVFGTEFLERYAIRLDPRRRRLVLPPRRRLSLILV